MGLDMYLTKKTYIGNKYKDKEEMIDIKIPDSQKKVSFPVKENSIKKERISEISEEIGYWRKANAIHQWFVDNVQDGEDDCKEYYVSKEKLKELIEKCEKTLMAPKLLGKKLLPTQSGFFFGSEEYDEYYKQDLEETVKICKEAIKEIEENGASIYYSSSW